MLYAITTTGKVGLLVVAGLFVAWALITAMWIPKRNPDFPATLTGFLLVSSIFLVLQLGTVYWVTTTQEVETEEAAPGESTPAETTPTESTSTQETTTEETTTEATTTEGTSTEGTTTGAAEGKGDPVAGKAVFTSAGCVGCHTLADAGATGTVGPNLDEAMPSYDLVVERVTDGKGPMPPFKGQLSDQQIMDVAAYVSSVAGKS
jgi:mono/diheme cytochrome c family protein